MEIAYYPGCSLTQSSELYNHQASLVFSSLGIELKEIEDWNCCGATSTSKLNDFMAVAMPARNIGLAENAGFSEMVIPCSACYSKTLVAQKLLRTMPSLKEKINQELHHKVNGSIQVSSILEVLKKAVQNGALADKAVHTPAGLKPVCYYGCMMTRFPYDVEVPENVENPQSMEFLLNTLGVRPLDWNFKTHCCGASAAINNPETASKLMVAIMKDAVARGANCFVVSCPMCHMNLDAQQNRMCETHGLTERLPVLFITEVIGVALGIGKTELEIDRHFIDASGII